MGQTIGWRKFTHEKEQYGQKVEDLPDWFDGKWAGRFEWYIAMFDGETESRDECPVMGNGYYRPRDFAKFRESLASIKDSDVINQHWPALDMSEVRASWKECTDFLEAHPDVFVDYS